MAHRGAKVGAMNRLSFLHLAVALAGCGAPSHEVVRMKDGVMRATTYAEATSYCQKDRLTLQVIGKAPAETGVLFRCEP